jgi:hypothetical protein
MNDKLKQIIFNKLYEDLKHVEIIPYEDSIWFIDRKNRYWYFEYEKSGTLYWKLDFFDTFFQVFSMKDDYQYERIISEWVEEVLNCKVDTSLVMSGVSSKAVEEILNCKVETSIGHNRNPMFSVEEALNCKVETSLYSNNNYILLMEKILNDVSKTIENER